MSCMCTHFGRGCGGSQMHDLYSFFLIRFVQFGELQTEIAPMRVWWCG